MDTPTRVKLKIISLLKHWVSLRGRELKKDVEWVKLFHSFRQFLKRGNTDDKLASGALYMCYQRERKFLRKKKNAIEHVASCSTDIKSLKKVTDIPTKVLAMHLTLLDQKKWFKLRRSDFMNTREGCELSKNTRQFIERFNFLSYWAATEIIISPSSPKERGSYICYFIRLLRELYELKNYNSLIAVLSSLMMNSISSLTSAWNEVPQKYHRMFKHYSNLVDTKSNWKNYREDLACESAPGIPLQGVLMKDLIFLHALPNAVCEQDKNVKTNAVDFGKLSSLAAVYSVIVKYRIRIHTGYLSPHIKKYLDAFKPLSEDELNRAAAKVKRHYDIEWNDSPRRNTQARRRHRRHLKDVLKGIKTSDITMEDLRTSPELYLEFCSFLEKRVCSKYMEFRELVEKYRGLFSLSQSVPVGGVPTTPRLCVAQKIYSSYLERDCSKQIKFRYSASIENTRYIKQSLATGIVNQNLFDSLYRENEQTLKSLFAKFSTFLQTNM